MPDLSLDLRYLRYCLAAAEHGSFRQTAKVLGISESTVSRRVKLLEHRLGFSLFHRDPRGVRITEAGESFLQEAAIGVTHFSRAQHLAASIQRGETGELRIGIIAALSAGYLAALLKAFHAFRPNVRVRIREGTSQDNLHRLAVGRLDVSFVTGRPTLPGHGAEVLWNERIFVALPSVHPLAKETYLTWDHIRAERFIVGSSGAGPEIHDFIVTKLSSLGFRPEIDVQDVGRESLLNLVGLGFGITLTSTSALQINAPGVVFLRIEGNDDELPSSAVWSARNTNPALSDLLAVARAVAKGFVKS